jgi:hypothetical protein
VLFNLSRNDKRQILQDILTVVQGQQDRCLQDRWKIQGLNGKKIVVRDVCAKMVSSIEKYMAVVDAAVQYELRIEDLLNSQQKLEAQLKKLEAPFVRTFDKISLLQNSLECAERIELLLSKVPYRELHRIISSQLSCGSGQWLLQN